MTLAKCPGCDKPRDLREPCGHCGAEPCAAVPQPPSATQPMAFDELEPAEAPSRKRAPSPGEALKRFSPMVEQSPVFAPARGSGDVPVVQPADPYQGLSVGVTARFEVASAPADAEPIVNLLLTLAPEGPPLIDPATGPIAHIILALDLSASMNHPDKYPVLTEALAGMLYELKSPNAAEVLVSIVVFAYGSATLVRNVPSKSIDPREVLDTIDRSPLRFGRYTDAVGALQRSGSLAKHSLIANRAMPVRIYLLTDGKPQDMDGTRAILAKVAKMPVDVDALAFGADADVAALQELVSGGRGGTVKQVRSDTLSEAFGRIAEVAQRVVANRALFELSLASGVVGGEAYRFRPARHRYGDAAFEGGTRFAADLGSLESGRPYTLLFELRLPRAKAGTETEVGRVSLRVPGFGGARLYEKLLALPRHAGASVAADAEVVAAREVLTALAGDDPQAMLKALRVRRRIYEEERRDRHVLGVIDKAISELEERGSLAALTASEHAALLSHTCTAGGAGRPLPRRREPSAN
jgi:uncharacterized protein YegL